MLLQALVPAWHQAAMAAARSPGELVPICTLYGYQMVPLASLAADGGAGKVKSPEHKPAPLARDCPLCQALAHQAPPCPPASTAAATVPVAAALAPWLAIAGAVIPAVPRRTAQPRAPPIPLA